jgi:hypothetical protein
VDQRAENYRLAARRQRAAEHRWRCYSFGHEILGQGAWTRHGRDDCHWRRTVLLRIGSAEAEVKFAVTFAANTNHMIEAYAETMDIPPLLIGQWSDDVRRGSDSGIIEPAWAISNRNLR